jgi:YidC/Oxa1 family membrane protein insertase
MDSNGQPQLRLLLAVTLAMIVLLGWSYFFTPRQPQNQSANQQSNANQSSGNTSTPGTSIADNSGSGGNSVSNQNTGAAQQANNQGQANPQAGSPQNQTELADINPQRSLTIKSPLYEVKLDSRGALATSWILLRNKSEKADYPIYADGSDQSNQKPLQLISQKALEQSPPAVPFRIITGNNELDTQINTKNYKISETADEIILSPGEKKQVTFEYSFQDTLVRKTFTFSGDSYVADLAITATQNGQPLSNAMLAIGASIGDHAINHHSFYHIESEAIASVAGDIKRHQGNYSFTNYDSDGRSRLADEGSVNWAGVGDAYFAMVAIPANQPQRVDYTAQKYDVNTEPFYDSIFNWIIRSPKTSETRHLVTAFIPITTDGSVTRIYTGTKDYFTLSDYDKYISAEAGRNVDLVHIINFSNYRILRPITTTLSIPILYALHYINQLVNNYGLAIIVFTFLFYSLLFPLRLSQSRSFKKAAGNAPKMKEIQDKIKELQKKGVPLDDPRMRSLQMEQLRLTKDALPIGGCLPMLLQFPLLIAFYTAITISLDARQASFLWLPDLSAADPWHILEFAFAISMILTMKFTPTAPAVSPEQQAQQKMMTYIMPVMMLWFMWTAPAGLLIYWLFGNIVSLGQQLLINKINLQPAGNVTSAAVPEGAKPVAARKV